MLRPRHGGIPKTCVVSLHNGAVTYWYGVSTGYVVEVSTSDDVIYYIAFGADRQEIFFGGALAITGCTLIGFPVPLTDTNCYPTTPYP